jgi:peptidoglycan/LPS O-acetylase OafA/YrhL
MTSDSIQTGGTGPARFEALDGLRAIAIAWVLLWHFTPGRDPNQGISAIVFKLATLGWTGVDLFFVLSGFLITGILLRAKLNNQPFAYFIICRILRIVPLYTLALLLLFFIIPIVLAPYPIPGAIEQLRYWLFFANYKFNIAPPLGGLFRVDHFWSLAIEMQFYLVWPLVIFHATPRTVFKIALVILAGAFMARAAAVYMGSNSDLTFAFTPFRIDGLIVGSLLAVARATGVKFGIRCLYAILIAGFAFALLVIWFDHATAVLKRPDAGVLNAWLRVLLPGVMSITFGALMWLALQKNRLSLFLSHAAFKPLARYSYGIYVIHFIMSPLFERAFGPEVLRQWTGGRDLPIYIYFVLASACSVIAAMLSYHLFELHFLQLKEKLRLSFQPKPASLASVS